MPEKAPDIKLPTPEEVLRYLGKKAAEMKLPTTERTIVPGMLEHDDGTVTFLSAHRYVSPLDIIPLSQGPINPNNN